MEESGAEQEHRDKAAQDAKADGAGHAREGENPEQEEQPGDANDLRGQLNALLAPGVMQEPSPDGCNDDAK